MSMYPTLFVPYRLTIVPLSLPPAHRNSSNVVRSERGGPPPPSFHATEMAWPAVSVSSASGLVNSIPARASVIRAAHATNGASTRPMATNGITSDREAGSERRWRDLMRGAWVDTVRSRRIVSERGSV
jgi:hypothetical protein